MLVQVSYHGGVGCRTTHNTDDSDAHVFTWVDIAHVLAEESCPHPCTLTILSASSQGRDTCGALSQVSVSPCTEHHRAHFSLSPSPVTRAPAPSQPQSSSRLWREINITRTRPDHVELSTGLREIPQYPTLLKAPTRTAFRILANQRTHW